MAQAQTQFNLVPNGDFEIPDGKDWDEDASGGVWSYPATGGNTGGYAKFEHTSPGGAWGGVLISPADGTAPFNKLEALGLAIGDKPVIQWDAKTTVMGTLAGVKIEAYNAAGVLINQASDGPGAGYNIAMNHAVGTWETFQSTGTFAIPLLTDSIKFVPLYKQGFGADSNVTIGFDNIGVYGAILTWTTTDGEVTITDCKTSATGELVIPDTIEGKLVTSIGDSAFAYCTSLASVTIPDSVTSIGDEAFAYSTSLTSVTIPDSVTSIGTRVFDSCTSLTSITVDAGNSNGFTPFRFYQLRVIKGANGTDVRARENTEFQTHKSLFP